MIKAGTEHKEHIISILTAAFANNDSVNYIVKQDGKRMKRIARLMRYSFDICKKYGEVLLSDNRHACALILYPQKKKTNFQSIISDLQFIGQVCGPANLSKVLNREKRIKALQLKAPHAYLWFIATDPQCQQKGIGDTFLKKVLSYLDKENNSICLETSVPSNIVWYQKNGFEVYGSLDLEYELFFMKRD